MLQFICGFALGFSLVTVFVCFFVIKSWRFPPFFAQGAQSVATAESSISKEFAEEDQKQAKEFKETLQALNEFMTGNSFEEEINHVGQQE